MKRRSQIRLPPDEIKLRRPKYTGWFRHIYVALDFLFDLMPRRMGTVIATLIIFMSASIIRGDWVFIVVQFIQNHKRIPVGGEIDSWSSTTNNTTREWSNSSIKLHGLSSFIVLELIFSYTMYFFICGFLQWYFYIRQRDTSIKWKCQPERFLQPHVERHEIMMGCINVGLGGTFFACLACYIYNGGNATSIYFNPSEYGWIWFLLSIPVHFLYQDAAAYYVHRVLHLRFVYVNLHKWHHYYKQPTAFSATAMHPVEMIFFQAFMILPAFCIPLHAGVYMGQMIYIFYYGLITHSGIEMESFWPWQPTVSFHDNHHQYFHVNFGFNTELFDKLHGTRRKKERFYNEQIYGGKGLDLDEISDGLKQEHAIELSAEKIHKM